MKDEGKKDFGSLEPAAEGSLALHAGFRVYLSS
jgi:hypothetical protein